MYTAAWKLMVFAACFCVQENMISFFVLPLFYHELISSIMSRISRNLAPNTFWGREKEMIILCLPGVYFFLVLSYNIKNLFVVLLICRLCDQFTFTFCFSI